MTFDVLRAEHESGLRPLGEYPDHCDDCRWRADMIERQATCAHEWTNEVRTMDGRVVMRLCDSCGGGC